jgi:hypothetical protein
MCSKKNYADIFVLQNLKKNDVRIELQNVRKCAYGLQDNTFLLNSSMGKHPINLISFNNFENPKYTFCRAFKDESGSP